MLISEKAGVVADEEQQGLRDEDDEELNISLPDGAEEENEVDNSDIEPEIEIITSDLGIQEVCSYCKNLSMRVRCVLVFFCFFWVFC
jgi:hypothetical protein